PVPPALHPPSLHDALPISANLWSPNVFLSLYTSYQGAACSVPLLCATIDPTSSTYVRQPPVIGDNPTHHSSLVLVAAEAWDAKRSEEHTSELQSPDHIVCR